MTLLGDIGRVMSEYAASPEGRQTLSIAFGNPSDVQAQVNADNQYYDSLKAQKALQQVMSSMGSGITDEQISLAAQVDPNLALKLYNMRVEQAQKAQEQAMMQQALGGGMGGDVGSGAEALATAGAITGNPQMMQLAQFKQIQQNREQDLQKSQEESAYKKEQNVFDIEKGLRAEFKDRTKSFIEQRDAFGRIIASAKDPSGAGDLALIFNYMKVLDPGSTVREGEFANAENSGGVPAAVANTYNKVVSGERLTPEMRRDFVKRAGMLYNSAESQVGTLADEYRGLSFEYGANPERVIGKYGLPEETKKEYDSLLGVKQDISGIDLSQARQAPDGNYYIEQDGKYYRVEQ